MINYHKNVKLTWGLSSGAVEIPLISHIRENLYMGGVIDKFKLNSEFKYVVSLHPWERYHISLDTERIEAYIEDDDFLPHETTVQKILKQTNLFLSTGEPTLIHCQMGLNRSGLITVLALRNLGYSSGEAIHLLRERRSDKVLFNKVFEDYLRGLDNA